MCKTGCQETTDSAAGRVRDGATAGVVVQEYPHPFRALLAICSDEDETPDQHVYRESARFLNTTEPTAMGPGVGLEVGNSIYFDMPPDQFAYWNTDDAGREMVRTLMHSGHIDCLHSYGDLAVTRAHAERALAELDRHRCRLRVWVDHARARTNFGADIMGGQGDVRGGAVYHADLTLAHGVRYLSCGRVTSVVGQHVRPSLAGIFHAGHPRASSVTLAKEATKRVLALLGNQKYAMHGPNRVMRPMRLRDGQKVYEFLRCNPHWGGVSCGDTAAGVAEVLTERFLRRLVRRQGVCILYTHLGKVRDRGEPFEEPARAGLRRLAGYRDDGRILVTTTHRLLRYLTVRDSLRYRTERAGERLTLIIEGMEDSIAGPCRPSLDELQGITFVVPGRVEAEVRYEDGCAITSEIAPLGGRTRVAIPWRPLVFPKM